MLDGPSPCGTFLAGVRFEGCVQVGVGRDGVGEAGEFVGGEGELCDDGCDGLIGRGAWSGQVGGRDGRGLSVVMVGPGSVRASLASAAEVVDVSRLSAGATWSEQAFVPRTQKATSAAHNSRGGTESVSA